MYPVPHHLLFNDLSGIAVFPDQDLFRTLDKMNFGSEARKGLSHFAADGTCADYAQAAGQLGK